MTARWERETGRNWPCQSLEFGQRVKDVKREKDDEAKKPGDGDVVLRLNRRMYQVRDVSNK